MVQWKVLISGMPLQRVVLNPKLVLLSMRMRKLFAQFLTVLQHLMYLLFFSPVYVASLVWLLTSVCLLLFSSYLLLDLLIKWYFIITPLYIALVNDFEILKKVICFVCHWLNLLCRLNYGTCPIMSLHVWHPPILKL